MNNHPNKRKFTVSLEEMLAWSLR